MPTVLLMQQWPMTPVHGLTPSVRCRSAREMTKLEESWFWSTWQAARGRKTHRVTTDSVVWRVPKSIRGTIGGMQSAGSEGVYPCYGR